MDAAAFQSALDATALASRELRGLVAAPESALLQRQRALLLRCATELAAAATAHAGAAPAEDGEETAPGAAAAAPSAKRPRTALDLTSHRRRTVRPLNQLPPVAVVHATFYLTLRELSALDATCQRFHPVGLTQKACMMRAGMWLRPVEWARVERPAMSWPRWLGEVRYRGRLRLRQQGRGRIAAGGGGFEEECFTLAVSDDGTVRSSGSGGSFVLGHGDEEDQPLPKLVEALRGKRVVQVATNFQHCLALTEGGHVLSWGRGKDECLGHGDKADQPLPKLIEALRGKKVLQISAGTYHSVVRLESGELRRTDPDASDGWACLLPGAK